MFDTRVKRNYWYFMMRFYYRCCSSGVDQLFSGDYRLLGSRLELKRVIDHGCFLPFLFRHWMKFWLWTVNGGRDSFEPSSFRTAFSFRREKELPAVKALNCSARLFLWKRRRCSYEENASRNDRFCYPERKFDGVARIKNLENREFCLTFS